MSRQYIMGFRFRRSVKILPGIRLNFGKRGISTSIGVRGAHVTFSSAGTRTTVGLPGSGLSYTHLDKPHRHVPIVEAAQPLPQGSVSRGLLWIVIMVVAVVVAIGRLISSGAPPTMPVQPAAQPPTSAQIANAELFPAIDLAARGAAQIAHTVANSSTLRFSRVTAMPNGAICYRFNLRNSRRIVYGRSAVMDGPIVTISGSPAFDALWNRRCSNDRGGRDITSALAGSSSRPR